jgi:pilus assembly protein Flp/PilA
MSHILSQRGQGLIEYVILVALVGVATMGMVRILQKSVNASLANVTETLEGRAGHKHSGDTITEDQLRKKDFSDFMNGAASK